MSDQAEVDIGLGTTPDLCIREQLYAGLSVLLSHIFLQYLNCIISKEFCQGQLICGSRMHSILMSTLSNICDLIGNLSADMSDSRFKTKVDYRNTLLG